ncbi:MAG: TatD family deoxyribonuclease, partial [Chitinophagaceae bacterium]
HPWYIDPANWSTEFNKLSNLVNHPALLAIGECGLDRVCNSPFDLQLTVFKVQVQLANRIAKPLLLHCVRAHEDILQILQRQRNRVPAIFHGYNNGKAPAEKIISAGHYLSFGDALNRPIVQEVFRSLPLDQLFLETDGRNLRIKELYELAAAVRSMEVNELILQLHYNLKKVFNLVL